MTQDQLPIAHTAADLTPEQLLSIAVSKGVDTEQLKELAQLQREWKADRAREAFVRAMNEFRKETLTVEKTKAVRFKPDGPVAYKHATLANAVDVVAPALGRHGLSHRWETKQDGTAITVTCVITHEMGHSIQNSLTASPDTSGSKNAIQAVGSTVSYLQRYTFLAITGLATKDQDTDGVPTGATIDETQAAELQKLMDEIGIVGPRKDKMFEVWRITKLTDILVKDFEACKTIIEKKRKA